MDRPPAGDRRQSLTHGLAVPAGWAAEQYGGAVCRTAVPHDRRLGQAPRRHPRRHELRRHADRADEPVDSHVLRHDRPQRQEGDHQPGAADQPRRGAEPLHAPERLVPARGGRPRHDRARQARRSRGPQQRLLRRAERGPEEDPLGADRGRRKCRLRRRRAGPARVMDASFLLDEYRARLRALRRRRSLRGPENPYLELMTLLVGAPSELSPALDLAERRRELASLFSWAIPNARALEVLAARAPLIECGSGMGYWSALLRARGTDVLAYDAAPPGRSSKNAYHRAARAPWTRIHRQSSVVAARRHRERTLVLCWPPYDDDAASYAVLRAYRGDTLIYIGEPDEGATGSVRFHRELRLNWA